MTSGLPIIDPVERVLGWIEETVAIALLLAIAGLVNLQIVARYVFSAPFMWPEEITKVLLVWLCYIAAAAVTRRSGHIAVDTLVMLLPPLPRRIVSVLLELIVVATFGLMVVISYRLVVSVRGMNLIATDLPTSILVWPLALGSVLIVLHSILRIVRSLKGMTP